MGGNLYRKVFRRLCSLTSYQPLRCSTRFASRSLQAYWSGGYLDSVMSFVVSRYRASDFQKSSSIICNSRSSTPADFCWRTSYTCRTLLSNLVHTYLRTSLRVLGVWFHDYEMSSGYNISWIRLVGWSTRSSIKRPVTFRTSANMYCVSIVLIMGLYH